MVPLCKGNRKSSTRFTAVGLVLIDCICRSKFLRARITSAPMKPLLPCLNWVAIMHWIKGSSSGYSCGYLKILTKDFCAKAGNRSKVRAAVPCPFSIIVCSVRLKATISIPSFYYILHIFYMISR